MPVTLHLLYAVNAIQRLSFGDKIIAQHITWRSHLYSGLHSKRILSDWRSDTQALH